MKIAIEVRDIDNKVTTFVIWHENDGGTPYGTIGFKIVSDGDKSPHRYIDLDNPLPEINDVNEVKLRTDRIINFMGVYGHLDY